MKKLLFFLIVLCVTSSVFADSFYQVSLTMNNGDVKNGYAELFYSGLRKLSFKMSENANIEKIDVDVIGKIVYFIDGQEYEFAQLKVYTGWKQEQIGEPIWLQLDKKGIVSLYDRVVYVSTPTIKDMSTGLVTKEGSAGKFTDYYVIRNGEPAAKWIAIVASANSNQMFRAKAPLYFSDYPELAEKIRNKEYKWNDLEKVIDIYNNWAKHNK